MTKTADDRPARFVNELARLERGDLAALRRGLGGDETPAVIGLSERLFARSGYREPGKTSRDALQIVAGLYALKPQARDEEDAPEPDDEAEDAAQTAARAETAPSIGKLMGRLYLAQDERPSTEKRFLALLDADRDGLGYHLRQAVMLLSTVDLTPDWVRLTEDLLRWSDPVRRQWARDFYSEIHREVKDSPAPDGASTADAAPILSATPQPVQDDHDQGDTQ